MARRPKSGPAPAHRATPATDNASPPAGAVGAGPVDFSPPAPSAVPGVTEPTVTTASTTGDTGFMHVKAESGAADVSVPFVTVLPPAAAVSCRHAVMRAGWDGKGKGRKPIRRCDECGHTIPRDEDGRPTVTWT